MKSVLAFLILVTFVLFLPWIVISTTTSSLVYTDIDTVPERTYGLLLGTGPGKNETNLFFQTRITAAMELYERGKIQYILVSGDNSSAGYNEPEYMRAALVRAGVPEKNIILDYAGFRTLDSILRAKEVFSLTDNLTIISQPFHVERALFLAKVHGIHAIGYGAADVSLSQGMGTYIREIGARWLAVYDAYFGTSATVLGDKIPLPVN